MICQIVILENLKIQLKSPVPKPLQTLSNKRFRQRLFSVNFARFFRALFYKTPPSNRFWNSGLNLELCKYLFICLFHKMTCFWYCWIISHNEFSFGDFFSRCKKIAHSQQNIWKNIEILTLTPVTVSRWCSDWGIRLY